MAIRLQEIPLSTPVDLLPKNILLQFDNAMCLVERDRGPGKDDGRIAVRFFHENESGPSEFLVLKTRVLKDFVMQAGRGVPIRAFSLPPGQAGELQGKKISGVIRFGGAALAVIAWIVFWRLWLDGGWGAGLTGRMVLLVGILMVPSLLLLFLTPGKLLTKGIRKLVYTMDGKVHSLKEFELPADRSTDADERVNAVKEEYGRLLSDIAYRVEFPALFDAGDPCGEKLALVLFEWDSTSARLEADEKIEMAAAIETAFRIAREHAERVGMRHFPPEARGRAEKVLHCIRVARDTAATSAERRAAMKAAIDILEDLALYYLPGPEEARLSLEGRRVRQLLPGRRES
ncbi:hypothetical protein [Arachnia propionica]|jgi:hypothetical protein|uniref:hypothetical protein n=1 Tax=Arachnia propionica TaxID=1750 RepID=UPI0028E87034|nr:hypothetical protein [Arachnia propionica]